MWDLLLLEDVRGSFERIWYLPDFKEWLESIGDGSRFLRTFMRSINHAVQYRDPHFLTHLLIIDRALPKSPKYAMFIIDGLKNQSPEAVAARKLLKDCESTQLFLDFIPSSPLLRFLRAASDLKDLRSGWLFPLILGSETRPCDSRFYDFDNDHISHPRQINEIFKHLLKTSKSWVFHKDYTHHKTNMIVVSAESSHLLREREVG